MRNLRDLARQRYRENAERQMQMERARRFVSAFLFGLALTTAVVLTMQSVLRIAARPVITPIERGLQ